MYFFIFCAIDASILVGFCQFSSLTTCLSVFVQIPATYSEESCGAPYLHGPIGLSFSGGGIRAATLASGLLEEVIASGFREKFPLWLSAGLNRP